MTPSQQLPTEIKINRSGSHQRKIHTVMEITITAVIAMEKAIRKKSLKLMSRLSNVN